MRIRMCVYVHAWMHTYFHVVCVNVQIDDSAITDQRLTYSICVHWYINFPQNDHSLLHLHGFHDQGIIEPLALSTFTASHFILDANKHMLFIATMCNMWICT